MAKAIFKALLTLIANIVSIFMSPINTLVSTAFPDLTYNVGLFRTYVGYLVQDCINYFNWFLYIFPQSIRNLIVLYLSILVIKYTVTLSVHLIVKVITIIKAIKIW